MKITISGLAGTGKSTVAKLLANHLGYQNMSGGGIFRQMAEEQGMSVEEFDAFVNGGDESFDKKLDTRQQEYGASNDNFVLESRLGWYFVPDAIKIKLVCDLDERIRRIAEDTSDSRIAHTQADFETTKKKTLDREATYSRYDSLYGIKEWNADEHFDYIIDTTHISPQEVVAQILGYIQ
ncbi:MAG: (d)CMP kinase [Patescibacteria group bacterium]